MSEGEFVRYGLPSPPIDVCFLNCNAEVSSIFGFFRDPAMIQTRRAESVEMSKALGVIPGEERPYQSSISWGTYRLSLMLRWGVMGDH